MAPLHTFNRKLAHTFSDCSFVHVAVHTLTVEYRVVWLSGSNPNGPICNNNVIIIITQMELVWEHSKMVQPQVDNVLLTIIYFNNFNFGADIETEVSSYHFHITSYTLP